MHDYVEKSRLPPSVLGENRCFQIGYFGHGDIIISSWQGALDHTPRHDDGVSARFGFAHGSDTKILASMAGFLIRAGKDKEEVRQLMVRAGEDILSEGAGAIDGRYNPDEATLSLIAAGDTFDHFDEEELGLECLVPPISPHPGRVEEIGGTGIYTHLNDELQAILLVFGGIESRLASRYKNERIGRTAEFCEQDIPIIAKMICSLALGDYRKDIHAFLRYEFLKKAEL